jgi:hypothetical protein
MGEAFLSWQKQKKWKKIKSFLALSLVSRNFFLKRNHQIGSGKQPQIEEDQDLLLLLFAFISGI